jgi:pectate lyase
MRFLLVVLFLFSASAIAQDVTPPVISNISPSGPLPFGTTSVVRSVTTDENATCKISITDIPYADMTTLFTNTGGVSHSTSSFSVTNGTSYTRYIRCIDGQGNANTTSAVMTFNIQAGPAAVLSNPLPARRQAYSPTVTLGVTTDVSATCRYSVTDVPYSEMTGTFSSTGGTTHSNPGFAVTPNIGNTVYLKCSTTTGGYVNTTSAMANFSVAGLVDVPAFPGAEGGGALSVGGRGGVVCEVTNLNASGAGSFKACVDMKGPRTVVFRVSGNITPSNPIEITNPYITIAGQTAPGGGIAIIGGGTGWSYLRINTHDVVIRNIKVRKGYRLNSTSDSISIEEVSGGLRPENVILDHVSASWGSDEIIGIWGTSTEGGVHIPNNISIQNSMIYEAFRGHSTGLLTGSNSPANAEQMINIDTHRSLFAFNSHRNPLYKTNESRFINNIVYHWRLYPIQTSGGAFDVVGNLFKHPNPNYVNSARRAEIQVYRRGDGGCTTSGCGPNLEPSIFAAGNSGPWHPDPSDNTDIVKRVTGENGEIVATLESQYRRIAPLASTTHPVTVIPVTELESRLLPILGASRRFDCLGNWVSNRDASDERIISHVIAGYDPNWGDAWDEYGIAHQDDVGGFPVLAPGTACTDTDGDGMPDEYETNKGLNPNSAADGSTVLANGYTNLEMFLAGPFQLSGLLPASGSQLTKAATSAQIQVQTNSSSSCRWSQRPNVAWSNMTPYASTGGIAHSGTLPVEAGGVYQVCNRCYDTARLEYSADSCTSFSVEANPKFMVW